MEILRVFGLLRHTVYLQHVPVLAVHTVYSFYVRMQSITVNVIGQSARRNIEEHNNYYQIHDFHGFYIFFFQVLPMYTFFLFCIFCISFLVKLMFNKYFDNSVCFNWFLFVLHFFLYHFMNR